MRTEALPSSTTRLPHTAVGQAWATRVHGPREPRPRETVTWEPWPTAAPAHGGPGPWRPLAEDESPETLGVPLLPAPAVSVARGQSPWPPPASMGLRASGTGQLPAAAVVHGAGPSPLGPPWPLLGSGSGTGTGTAPPPATHLRAKCLPPPRLRPAVPTWLVRAPVLPAHDAPVLLRARLAHDRLERVEPGEPGPLQAERTREQRRPWGPRSPGRARPPYPAPALPWVQRSPQKGAVPWRRSGHHSPSWA